MFKLCRRKFFFTYVLGWRPVYKATPFRFGSGVHLGLDWLAKGMSPDAAADAIDSFYEAETAAYADAPEFQEIAYRLSLECVTVQRLVKGYAWAWRESHIEIVESEKSFDLPIVNPDTGAQARIFRQSGKRDRIGRLPDGRLALMETKTAGEDIGPDSDYRNHLLVNQQVSMYIAAARTEGHDLQTTLYDVIRKPGIRPTPMPVLDEQGLKVVLDAKGERVKTKAGKWRETGDKNMGYVLQTTPMTPKQWSARLSTHILENPAYYYQRFEVARLQSDLDEWAQELWAIVQDIHACTKAGRWWRNTDACRYYKRMCPYWTICTGQVACDAGCPVGFRQARHAHEELQEADEGNGNDDSNGSETDGFPV
jgi:hypothetical protein